MLANTVIPKEDYKKSTLAQKFFQKDVLLSMYNLYLNLDKNQKWQKRLIPRKQISNDLIDNPLLGKKFYQITIGPSLNTFGEGPLSVFDNLSERRINIETNDAQMSIPKKSLSTPSGIEIFREMWNRSIGNLAAVEETATLSCIAHDANKIYTNDKKEIMDSVEPKINRYYRYTNYISKVKTELDPYIQLTKDILNLIHDWGYIFEKPATICSTIVVRTALAQQTNLHHGVKVTDNKANQTNYDGVMIDNPSAKVIECNVGLVKDPNHKIRNPLNKLVQFGNYGVCPLGKEIKIYDTKHDAWAELKVDFKKTGLFSKSGVFRSDPSYMAPEIGYTIDNNHYPKIFISEMASSEDKSAKSINPDYLINVSKRIVNEVKSESSDIYRHIEQGINLMNKLNNPPSIDALYDAIVPFISDKINDGTLKAADQNINSYITGNTECLKAYNPLTFAPTATKPYCFGSVVGFLALDAVNNTALDESEKTIIRNFNYSFNLLYKKIIDAIPKSWFTDEKIVYGFLSKEWLSHLVVQMINEDRPVFLAIDTEKITEWIKTGEKGDKFKTLNLGNKIEKKKPGTRTATSRVVNIANEYTKWVNLLKTKSISKTNTKITNEFDMYYKNFNIIDSLGTLIWDAPISRSKFTEFQEHLIFKFLFDVVSRLPLYAKFIDATSYISNLITEFKKTLASTTSTKENVMIELQKLISDEKIYKFYTQLKDDGISNFITTNKLQLSNLIAEMRTESVEMEDEADSEQKIFILPMTISRDFSFDADKKTIFLKTDTIHPASLSQTVTPPLKKTFAFIEGDIYGQTFGSGGYMEKNVSDLFNKAPSGISKLPKEYTRNFAYALNVMNGLHNSYSKLGYADKIAFVMYCLGFCTADNFDMMYQNGIPTPLYFMWMKPHILMESTSALTFGEEETLGMKYVSEMYTDVDKEGKNYVVEMSQKFMVEPNQRIFTTENVALMREVNGDGMEVYDPEMAERDPNYYNPMKDAYGNKSNPNKVPCSLMFWVMTPLDYENKYRKKIFANTIDLHNSFDYIRRHLRIELPQDAYQSNNISMYEHLEGIWKFSNIKFPANKKVDEYYVNTILRIGTMIVDGHLEGGNSFDGELLDSGKNNLNIKRFIKSQ
jgi:hypothetical protein